MPVSRLPLAVLALTTLALAACERNPLLVRRSACPAVAVPTYTGDITVFRPGTSPDAKNVDLVATITNVRDVCVPSNASLATDVTYDVLATRSDTAGARSVSLPVFATVVQGGNLIVSKQIGAVTIAFADGQARATGRSGARASVSRAAATPPPDIQRRIGRKRRAGDIEAATDPLGEPEVRAALRAASFEVLVGFQLDDAGLAYNVTK